MRSAVPQPVVAQLTRAAIFLVVTINPGKETMPRCGPCAAIWLLFCAQWVSAIWTGGCHV